MHIKTKKLPTSWTDSISSVMAKAIPSCCINFKRHKVYKDGELLANFGIIAQLKVVN